MLAEDLARHLQCKSCQNTLPQRSSGQILKCVQALKGADRHEINASQALPKIPLGACLHLLIFKKLFPSHALP